MKLLGLILLLTYTGCSSISSEEVDETWDLLYIANQTAEITPDPKNWGEDEC